MQIYQLKFLQTRTGFAHVAETRGDEINGDRKFWICRVVSANKLTSSPKKHAARQKSPTHRWPRLLQPFAPISPVTLRDYRARDLFEGEDLN